MTVHLPRYDRAALTAGIVHIGLGNFHRAHMAVYLDDGKGLNQSQNQCEFHELPLLRATSRLV